MGTTQAIAEFDLETELLEVFADKAAVGALLHSDYCRIGGRTVSDWLTSPGQLPSFLATMQSTGWIERGRAPERSRFWKLLTDPQAPMFGVFDAREQQLISDWITNDAQAATPAPARAVNRFRRRPADAGGSETAASLPHGAAVEDVIAHRLGEAAGTCSEDDLRWLRERLDAVSTKARALSLLEGLLSPANHPTPVGLIATRLYADLLAMSCND
jgi:hypothetical protein